MAIDPFVPVPAVPGASVDAVLVVNAFGNSWSWVAGELRYPIPLTTTIGALPQRTAHGATVNFNFTTRSLYSPSAPAVRQVYYQVDSLSGRWSKASPEGGSGSGATPSLTKGYHFVYAFGVDGMEAGSINTGNDSSPIPGGLASYFFLVTEGRQNLPVVVR
jgi:hypothetical protein